MSAGWKERHPRLLLLLKRENRQNLKDIARKGKDVPCKDCGQRYPFYVMHYDHVRGEKQFNIASVKGCKVEVLLNEMKKCDVVCANCHAERTWSKKQHLVTKRVRLDSTTDFSIQEEFIFTNWSD